LGEDEMRIFFSEAKGSGAIGKSRVRVRRDRNGAEWMDGEEGGEAEMRRR